MSTTSTSARRQASSARTPSSEVVPSPSCSSEPPRPSRVPSRSRYRQRTPSSLRMGAMAVTRRTEPWTALLDAGRADERLVREAYEGAREPRFVADARRPAPGRAARGSRAPGSTRSTPTRPRRSRRAWAARRSSRPARRRASRCASTCRRSTCCAPTPRRARSTSTRRRRSPRTRRARCNAFGLPQAGAPRDLRRRHAARGAHGDPPARRTSCSRTPTCSTSGSCPTTRAWGDFFANLAVVVVDEAHVYRGVFGSHVANVLRRLRRIAGAYGTEPRFLLASATIANPVELAERLTGLDDVALVDRDGSPGARRQIAMWNPPVVDEALQLRRSALGEAAEIVAELVRDGRADDLLHQVAQGGRARRARIVRERAAATRARRPRRALPRRLHAPAAPRARGAADERRAAARSSRPTRSSSASTSARSTRRCA